MFAEQEMCHWKRGLYAPLLIALFLGLIILALITYHRESSRDILLKEAIQRVQDEKSVVAVELLGSINDKRAIPELVKLLKNKESINLYCAAMDGLVKLNAKESATEIVDLLNDKNWWLCEKASETLVKLDAKEVIPELIELLSVEYHTTLWLSNDMYYADIDSRYLHGLVAITLIELNAKDKVPEENIRDIEYLASTPIISCAIRAKTVLTRINSGR